MIKANDLDGRAVVNLESAKKVGYVDEIYLDTDGAQIAAFQVSEGSKLTGGGQKVLIPASAVQSIGPEAIMVRTGGEARAEHGSFERLPRLSHIVGKKVVTEGGKLVGAIDDVLLDGDDARIHGYTLKSANWAGGLGDLFGTHDRDRPDYVRADANLRLGDDLLVVPEDAIVYGAARHDGHDAHDDDRDLRRDHVRDRDHERSSAGSIDAIDALSRRHTTSPRTGMAPPQPAGVEYAEPIGRTESVRYADTTPTADTMPIRRTEAVRSDVVEPDFVEPNSRIEHWDDVRGHYRSRWEQRTAGRGGLWEEHEPGYRYGWEMANKPNYRGQTWTTAEPELRRDWETRHHDNPWDRAVDAVRDAWDNVTGHDETDVAGYRSSHRDHDANDASLTANERLYGHPATEHHEDLPKIEHLGSRRVADEGPDSRRPLL